MKKVLALMLSFAIGFTSICLDVRAAEAETVVSETVETENTSDAEEVEEIIEEPVDGTIDEPSEGSQDVQDAPSESVDGDEMELLEELPVEETVELDEALEENSWEISLDSNTNTLYCGKNLDDYSVNIEVLAFGEDKFVKQNPVFTSSDSNVVTVTANRQTPKLATILAVGPGTATISVKFAGEVRNLDITVVNLESFEGVEFVTPEITLTASSTAKKEVRLAILPETLNPEAVHVEYSGYNDKLIKVVKDPLDETKIVVSVADDAISNMPEINKTTITATAKVGKDPTPQTAECEVTVDTSIDDKFIRSIETYLKSNVVFVVPDFYSGKNTKLSEIAPPELPADKFGGGQLIWAYGDEVVQADNNLPTQYFQAYYSKPNCEKKQVLVPMHVTSLTGITFTTQRKNLGRGEYLKVHAGGKYVGYQPTERDFERISAYYSDKINFDIIISTADQESYIQCTDKVSKKLLERDGYFYAVSKDVGDFTNKKHKLTATLQWGDKKYEQSANVDVIDTSVVGYVHFYEEESEERIDDYTCDLEDLEKRKTLTVIGRPIASGKDMTDKVAIKWHSDNPAVATVTADRQNKYKAVITFKKAGKALIYATPQDISKMSSSIQININDYTPVIENKTINMNYYQSGITLLGLHGQAGSEITGYDFSTPDNATYAKYFTMKYDSKAMDYGFAINKSDSTEKTFPKKVKANVNIKYRVNGEEKSKEIPVTINVKTSLPKVKVQLLEKANLAEIRSVALYEITSDVRITKIEQAPKDPVIAGETYKGFEFYQMIHEDNNDYRVDIPFRAEISNKDDIKKYYSGANATKSKTVDLLITVDGYSEPITTRVVVATKNTKPSYKINDVVLLQGAKGSEVDKKESEVGATYIYNNSDKKVENLNDATVKSLTDDVEVSNSFNTLQVERNKSNIRNFKIEYKPKDYVEPVILTGRFVDVKQYNVNLDKNKIVLNAAENWNQNGGMTVNASVQNVDVLFADPLSYSGADKNTAEALKSGYLVVKTTNRDITVGLGKTDVNSETYKRFAGKTFKIKVAGNVRLSPTQSSAAKPAVLTVATTKAAPQVRISTSGSIDVTKRLLESDRYYGRDGVMMCKTAVQNTSAAISRAVLIGNDSKLFDISNNGYSEEWLDWSVFVIEASKKGDYSINKTYNLTVRFTLDNGLQVDTPIKFKVKAKLPDVKIVPPPSVVLDRTVPGQRIKFEETISDHNYKVYGAEFTDTNNYLDFVVKSEYGCFYVYLGSNGVKLKPGTYYITAEYSFYNQPKAVKPVTKKIKVIVK